MDTVQLTALIPQGSTLDAVAFSGPDVYDDWQVFLFHLDGTYQAWEDRRGEPRRLYRGANKDAAVEHYLVAVRKLTMEALEVAYKPLVIEPGDE